MKRNLIYHCCPISSYKWNIAQILERWKLFDGEKIIAVATGVGERFGTFEQVASMFPKDATLLNVSNDPIYRETKTFKPLLDALKRRSEPDSITFYGHTKGVTHKGPQADAIKLWTRLMYEHNLDYPEKVEASLRKFSITGCFKRYGRFNNFPKGAGLWHYSGTFFWFKNADVFGRNWHTIPMHQYGTEAWPGIIFRKEEAGCLFADRILNPYNIKELRKFMHPAANIPVVKRMAQPLSAGGVKK